MSKTALVTGSTSGIGLEIAKRLAAEGYNIVVNGLGDSDLIEKICNDIRDNYQVEVLYQGADLADWQEIKTMVNFSISHFGSLDILVNNAGIQHVNNITNFPEEKWEQIINFNLSSSFYTAKYAIENMKNKGWGRIINIASTHGLVASVKKAAYVAAKHGVIGLTKVMALENCGNGITANSICPGWVLTPLVQKQIDKIAEEKNLNNEQATKELLLEKQPSGKFTHPEDIAETVIYLCSKAADNITGSTITLDGGWTAR